LKPWLLEVNQSPSFKTDAGLDTRVKGELIRDTLRLLNISHKRKMRYIAKVKDELK
jgi:tubulin polyglutamylase TTLL6/13